MRLTPLRRSGLLASAAVAVVATLAMATTAFADEPTTDERAVPFLKFVDFNHPEACTVGGLTGTPIHPGKFTYAGGDNQQYLDITGLPEGMTVTGMLVKAGDVFNVYLAGKLGDELPWNDLRAPVIDGGSLPEIGQWFGCGTVIEQPPSSSATTTTTTTTTSTVTHTLTPTSTASSAPTSSSSEIELTTTAATTTVPVPVAQVNDLAATGFGSAWLLGLGAALVAAGAAVLLVMRRRRA